MVKRIIGVVFTLVALVVIAFAAMNYGNYRSMLFKPCAAEKVDDAVVESTDSVDVYDGQILSEAPIVEVDTEVEQADSIAM